MANRNIIVIGASAGGVEALVRLVQQLPKDLPAALLVVMHFPANGISVLPEILQRLGSLPASHARDQVSIESGHIYVARPNQHLLVQNGVLRLGHGPKENGYRPSIDALFDSAATAFDGRVIGVILSGTLDDGVMGLSSIKANGGTAIVQDPEEALFAGMPLRCISTVKVDYVLTLAEMAIELQRLVAEPVKDKVEKDTDMANEDSGESDLKAESEEVATDKAALEQGHDSGNSPSTLTCPECGGVLWELQKGDLIRYRCHVGHTYSINSMLTEHTNKVEQALWNAVRILEEKASLSLRMATSAQANQRPLSALRFEESATQTKYQADLLRQVISQQAQLDAPEDYRVFAETGDRPSSPPSRPLSVDAIAGDRIPKEAADE